MKGIVFACLALVIGLAGRAWAADAAPNDAQIAQIVVTANTADIDAGKLARERSQNKQVQDFAVRMVTDHTGLNQQSEKLVHKLNVTPESNATSEEMKRDGEDNVANLKKLSGSDFDRSYIDKEVAMHQHVLSSLDKTLIPNAKNPELKALLEKARPVIASHLDQAKQIQSSLKSGKTGSGSY
jgi:putative membrane protein